MKAEFQFPYRSGMSRQGRTGAQDPENAVDRSPLVRDSRTTFAPIGKQWIENAPFRLPRLLQNRSESAVMQTIDANSTEALPWQMGDIIFTHLYGSAAACY